MTVPAAKSDWIDRAAQGIGAMALGTLIVVATLVGHQVKAQPICAAGAGLILFGLIYLGTARRTDIAADRYRVGALVILSLCCAATIVLFTLGEVPAPIR